jgi:hypothetical protein
VFYPAAWPRTRLTRPAPNQSAAILVAELARQRRLTNKLSFEVDDLREVHITGLVDLVALAMAAVRA